MSRPTHAARFIALLTLSALLSACSSSKPSNVPVTAAPAPAPAPPATLAQIRTDLLGLKAQMTTTTAAVNGVSKAAPADAQASFNQFSTEYAKLVVMTDNNRTRVADLKQRTKEYFDTWSKETEVLNPELKRRVLQQKSDAEKIFSTIKGDLEQGKLAFDPYMSNLKDVESYLRADLSPARIGTASDLIAKVNADGKEVSSRIDSVVAEIDKMMKASGAAEPSAPAKPAA